MNFYRVFREKTDGSSIAIGMDDEGRPFYSASSKPLAFLTSSQALGWKRRAERELPTFDGQGEYVVQMLTLAQVQELMK